MSHVRGKVAVVTGAVMPLAGHNAERMAGRFGSRGPETQDPDDVRY